MKLTGYEKASIVLAMVFIIIIIVYNSFRYTSNEDAIIEMVKTSTTSSAVVSLSSAKSNNESSASSIGKSSNINKIININTATKEELMELDGIGEVKAQSIIDDRELNGNFNSVDDIVRVNGIGEGTLNKIRPNITVK